MFGLNNLFWYYKKSVRDRVEIIQDHDEDDSLSAGRYFGT
jgi:hypothetical protein